MGATQGYWQCHYVESERMYAVPASTCKDAVRTLILLCEWHKRAKNRHGDASKYS